MRLVFINLQQYSFQDVGFSPGIMCCINKIEKIIVRGYPWLEYQINTSRRQREKKSGQRMIVMMNYSIYAG